MCLKINWSVITPWHRPGMGVARSGSWAADKTCQNYGTTYWYLIGHFRVPKTLTLQIKRWAPTLVLNQRPEGIRKWISSRVLKFEILALARQYFAAFYFRDFNRWLWKRTCLNFFKKSELIKISRKRICTNLETQIKMIVWLPTGICEIFTN